MSESLFTINDRFVIDRTRNKVLDKESGQKTRVEPRMIKLLCMLTDSPKIVVTRSRIINEIWDDYPGANEGLNQAISFLRKILSDANKELIVTIPKKGYVFNGVISENIESTFIENKKTRKSSLLVFGIVATVLFLSGWCAFFVSTESKTASVATRSSEFYRSDAMIQAKPDQGPAPFKTADEKNLQELSRIDMMNQANKNQHK